MKKEIILSFAFCLLLAGFMALSIAKPDNTFSETENRVLAQKPEITVNAIAAGEFESGYEEYLTDQFPWRDQWVGFKTSIERLLLKQESKDIYFGKDGYLIEKHTGAFDTEQAARNVEELAEFVQKNDSRANISIIIAPTAVEVLRDKLPPLAPVSGQKDYLAKLEAAVPSEIWVDAARALMAHCDEDIFYKTDHHWTTLGAFYVYQAWREDLGCNVPQMSEYDIQTVTDCFEGTIQSKLGVQTQKDSIELFVSRKQIPVSIEGREDADALYDFSALEGKDKYAVFLGGNQPFMSIATHAAVGKRLLVIKDSYANCFIPFLAYDFDEIDVIDLRYTKMRMSEMLAAENYSDILILYNVAGFAEDGNIFKLNQ